jgi:HEAT repeat protein
MIQDSRPPVRSLILEYLGKRRNPLAEELLLHYFEKSGPHLKDRRHLLACYRALGQCGSARSIPFLQDTLLGRDWKLFMGMGNSVHRLGAALALLSMPREKAAKALLEAANRSSFPGIRAAYRQAVEERKQGKEAGR